MKIIIVCTFFFFLSALHNLNADDKIKDKAMYHAILKRFSNNSGFHRDITTDILIQGSRLNEVDSEDCQLLLKEHIPTGLYVDLYQLASREQFGGPQVLSQEDISVENPEYLAQGHNVFVFSNLNKDTNGLRAVVEIPIHLRYHRPSTAEKYAVTKLHHPLILLKCLDDIISSKTTVSAPCDKTNSSICEWISISYSSDSSHLTFNIPVGQYQDTYTVTILTLFVTIFGCVLLMYVTVSSKHQKKVS